MDSMYLMGSEGVEKAGYAMQSAAESIRGSAGEITEALRMHAIKMEELVWELVNALKVEDSPELVKGG